MFNKLRRKDKGMDINKTLDLITTNDYGTFSTISNSGYPYSIPVNYVFIDNKIYFHCATEGHKINNILENNKVCFTVVGNSNVIPEKFSTSYSSAVIFGRASICDNTEKNIILAKLLEKYAPNFLESGMKYINASSHNTYVVQIDIDDLTGKQSL